MAAIHYAERNIAHENLPVACSVVTTALVGEISSWNLGK